MSSLLHPVREALGLLGRAGELVARAARGVVADALEQDDLARDRLAVAFARLGWRPMPVLALLGLLVGLAFGTAAARLLHSFYVERLIEPTVCQALARDVVPLLIGIFAAGRVAVETTVRLGAMRLSSELDALRITGHDAVRHVIAPALAAVLIATPLQVALVFAAAWMGFYAVLSAGAITSFPVLVATTLDDATFTALAEGGAKAMLFSVGALAIGATAGWNDTRGISAVGREAMQAFTAGLLYVIVIAVLSVVLR